MTEGVRRFKGGRTAQGRGSEKADTKVLQSKGFKAQTSKGYAHRARAIKTSDAQKSSSIPTLAFEINRIELF
jgi:hypothetical protein